MLSTPVRWILAVALLAAGVVGFLLFRPDTLFRDDRVDESLEEAFDQDPATSLPGAAVADTEDPATTTTTAPATASTTTSTTAPAEPVAVLQGTFRGIDHRAAGTAAIYEQDGRFVLRFEDDTDIQNGPDLYVWVLAATSYEGGSPGEYLDLGRLKGNVGGQNYQLPPDFDPDLHRTVLIWCLRFSVPFAAAELG